jgi:hypothetical protein
MRIDLKIRCRIDVEAVLSINRSCVSVVGFFDGALPRPPLRSFVLHTT